MLLQTNCCLTNTALVPDVVLLSTSLIAADNAFIPILISQCIPALTRAFGHMAGLILVDTFHFNLGAYKKTLSLIDSILRWKKGKL